MKTTRASTRKKKGLGNWHWQPSNPEFNATSTTKPYYTDSRLLQQVSSSIIGVAIPIMPVT